MAIPSSELPFQVLFREGTGSYESRYLIEQWLPVGEEASCPEPMAVLTENLPLRLQFLAGDNHARLYLDGLESVLESKLREDEQGVSYLGPGSYQLFSFDNYGWIPGCYWLRVVSGERVLTAQIEVQPKELSPAEWASLRDQLESRLRGLALELARRNLGLGSNQPTWLTPDLLHRFLVVKLLFPRVMAALADLQHQPNQRVRTVLRWPIDRDDGRIVSPGGRRRGHRLQTRRRVIDYDLPENRWVKRIIRVVSRQLRQFLLAASSSEQQLQQELTELSRWLHQGNTQQLAADKARLLGALESYQRAARRMQLGLQLLRHSHWYDRVGGLTPLTVPQALLTDGRYRSLHQLYRQLRTRDWQPLVDQSYHYQWKRTDRLYEIWCVIELCQALIATGYTPVSGWLYDQEVSVAQPLVPTLPAGTCIIFQQGTTRLQLVYDQAIPRQSSETSGLALPVYTQDVHNRPDLRLDLFRDGQVYAGCLIIDCKYRPLRGFWKPETLTTGYDRPKAMSQLISYGMAIRSPYLHGQPTEWTHRLSPAVLEVWAIHPGAPDLSEDIYVPDHRVRIISLRPGLSREPLHQRLTEVLDRA